MNVLMVLLGGYFPPDIRVEKEAKVLKEMGHSIFVLCSPRKEKQELDVYDDMRIIRLDYPHKILRLVDALHFYTNGGTFTWKNKIKKVIKDNGVQILHVHDLSLAGYSAICAAKELNCRIVQDLHENWADNMLAYYHSYKPTPKIVFFRYIYPIKGFYNYLERKSARRADAVITTIEEMRERVVRNGVEESKIMVIRNTEDSKSFDNLPVDHEIIQKYSKQPTGLFVGVLDRFRGIECVIESIPLIRAKRSDFHLVIVGDGPIKGELETRVTSLRVSDAVEFVGKIDFKKVKSYIVASALCYLTQDINEQINRTIAHKVFQYMLCEKPIILTAALPYIRMQKYRPFCYLIQNNLPETIAAATITCLNNPEDAQKLAKNARSLAVNEFDFAEDGKILRNAYKKLISNTLS